jgi:hypothetical protein
MKTIILSSEEAGLIRNTKATNIGDAYFTTFDETSNWVSGRVGKYYFEAKLFDVGSEFGIKKGRVSKLTIWDKVDKEISGWKDIFKGCIVNYDRGWDTKPTKEFKPYYDAVMSLLENAPKRWE